VRLGILPTGYIYPRELRPVRDLLRHRTRLVRNRTARLLTVQNLVARETGRRITGNRASQPSDCRFSPWTRPIFWDS
jgi:transposase